MEELLMRSVDGAPQQLLCRLYRQETRFTVLLSYLLPVSLWWISSSIHPTTISWVLSLWGSKFSTEDFSMDEAIPAPALMKFTLSGKTDRHWTLRTYRLLCSWLKNMMSTWWFSDKENFVPPSRHLLMSRNLCVCTTWGMLLASSGYRPATLLTVIYCPGQPPQLRIQPLQMSKTPKLRNTVL